MPVRSARMIRAELKRLAQHSAIYGVADVIPYLINFSLLPIFTTYLSRIDYGALGILLLFGVTTKIFFRLGLDTGFFRIYYDQKTDRDRKVLATTLFLAASGVSVTLFTLCALAAGPIGTFLLGVDSTSPAQLATWVILVAGDTLLNTFAFVPMNLFRIQGRPAAFTVMTLIRSGVNIGLKLWLVVQGWGVSGVLWADVIASCLFVLVLLPTLLRNLGWGVSRSMLREAVSFGFPKVPHALAHQILNLSDRKLIEVFLSLAATGLYHIGYMMGTGVKFFLAAFELAWGPWGYAQLSRSNAPELLSRMSTYACTTLLGFALLNAVFGRELLFLMAKPEFHEAHVIIPVIVLAYVLQGMFALTSIGIGISKKAFYYPILTISAALTNVLLNILWIPRYGILGAAWATVAGYGLMAVMGHRFGQKHYPIPFEWGRMGRVFLAAGLAYGVSLAAPDDLLKAVALKCVAILIYPAALLAFGFFRRDEIAWLKSVVGLDTSNGD